MTLPLALADLGLIDEYEFVVQPALGPAPPTVRDPRPAPTIYGAVVPIE